MRESANTRVLVIDDEEMVRDNIEEILVPRKASSASDSVNQAASILFDTAKPVIAPRGRNMPDFTVHKAANGMEGLEMVKTAMAEGKPYAVIFLDMRMPGWDGLETAMEIRKYDSQAEIIFVTAFSDRSIEEIVERAGQNVGYHCKPYASEEIVQLATKAVSDYSKLRNLEQLMGAISSISLNEHQLTSLLRNVLDQLATYVETDMALLGKLNEDLVYEKIFSIGALEEKVDIEELTRLVKDINIRPEEVVQVDEVVLARVKDYTIFAALKKDEKLKTEKLYLLKLFVQNAAKAIQNAQLQEELLRKEKLSAIGKAIGMVMHDLRSPVNNIGVLTELIREEGIQSEYLELIDQCGVQATDIFNDFLDFIRETSISKKPICLNSTIDSTLEGAERHMGKKKITISKDIPEGLVIGGDESKLRRCITNILNNAIDVLIDYKVKDPRIDITVSTRDSNKKVLINIKDNGPGIPGDIIKTLFEPFVTKFKSNGTGLGLAIVKQYIAAHGGEIKVANDNGARFLIELPAN
jgi:signal transduction histidine kinase/CheY-like chemotaxis protein